MKEVSAEKAFSLACERYAELGVSVKKALGALEKVAISLPCWQCDDVGGFEVKKEALSGGLAATGNYAGKPRTIGELRQDLAKAMSLIPGQHKVNLHAIYADTAARVVERNELKPSHFQTWIHWAKNEGCGLDFNPTCFSHPLAADGFTLSSRDSGIRRFWIEHSIACRKIAEEMGRQLRKVCVNNIWIPDGCKDLPADRKGPRERLKASLDAILAKPVDRRFARDSVEGKLFGIGSESYVVGSHDFYLGYAVAKKVMLCLDTGHFHPTETVSDKISAVMTFLDEILLHVSRGVRWDSDHVVILSDELCAIAQELVRGGYLDRVHIGLDFFDASINRIAALVIGARNMMKALLLALLEPTDRLRALEKEGNFTARLALLEELKTQPFGAAWDYFCMKQDVPAGEKWLSEVAAYEKAVLSKRN